MNCGWHRTQNADADLVKMIKPAGQDPSMISYQILVDKALDFVYRKR